MGIIYNPHIEEKELYKDYNMTVYGKVNRYEWTIYNDRESENCYITLKITDAEGNDIININLGNNAIMERVFNNTIDNFLYWIKAEEPTQRQIEEQIFRSLCQSDSIFNHYMMNRKLNDKRKAEEEKRTVERQQQEKKNRAIIETYCKENGLFFYIGYDEVIILKATTNNSRSMLADAQRNNNTDKIQMLVSWVEKYPNNNDVKIVKRGSMEEILQYIE